MFYCERYFKITINISYNVVGFHKVCLLKCGKVCLLWFNPGKQLNAMQLLFHCFMGEAEGQKSENSWAEIKAV